MRIAGRLRNFAAALAGEATAGRRPSQVRRTRVIVHRHVIIRGRVQGVGYRVWTEVTALERGLEGWVRNRRDSSVEAVFGGTEDDVTAMIADCRRGPSGARVETIDQREATPDEIALRRGDELFSVLRSV
jgi:acylphosphatase